MSITQTIVEERLQPARPVATELKSKATRPPLPSVLLRSTSFDRLKQFPSSLHAYFCRHGSIEIIKWIINSRTKLTGSIKQLLPQLHAALLVTSVYAAVGLICLQLVMCIVALSTVIMPIGLSFLLTCIVVMAALAIKLNLRGRDQGTQERRSRSRTRHSKQE